MGRKGELNSDLRIPGSGKDEGQLERHKRIQGKEDSMDRGGNRNMCERDRLSRVKLEVHKEQFFQH